MAQRSHLSNATIYDGVRRRDFVIHQRQRFARLALVERSSCTITVMAQTSSVPKDEETLLQIPQTASSIIKMMENRAGTP